MSKPTVKIIADIVGTNASAVRLKFYLNLDGYVIKFPSKPSLTIWVNHEDAKRGVNNVWYIDEKAFKKACEEPMEALKNSLIISHGMSTNLVMADLANVYPE